jgi:hypothetical protein
MDERDKVTDWRYANERRANEIIDSLVQRARGAEIQRDYTVDDRGVVRRAESHFKPKGKQARKQFKKMMRDARELERRARLKPDTTQPKQR